MGTKTSTTVIMENAEGEEFEFEVHATISTYHPATMYDSNGDPGSPEEGGELEDIEINPDPFDYGFDEDEIIAKANDSLYENADYYDYDEDEDYDYDAYRQSLEDYEEE
jgi:hypothetical protein